VESSEYTALFQRGAALIEGSIHLDGRQLSDPGFFEKRRLKKARPFFEQAFQADPLNAAPLFLLGKIEERLGNGAGNIEWLRRANDVEPNNPLVALELGAALGRRGMYQESLRVLGNAATRNPSDPRIHCNLGLSLLMAGEAEGAVHAFEHTTSLEPDVATNHKLLAYAIEVAAGRKAVPSSERDIARNI
jgi:Flp pilus assembly protein TadD